jgi:murein DD-endopeptidase MepM/ murein hydrolase activator NlpD
MNRRKILGLIAIALSLLIRASFAGEFPGTISLQSEEAFQGGVVKIEVVGKEIEKVQGILGSRAIPFFPWEGHSFHVGFLGVDLQEKAGPADLVIQIWSRGGEMRKKAVNLRIRDRTFPQEKLSVDKSFDRFDEATLQRIEKERARITRLWQLSSPRRLWEGRFIPPVPGAVSSPFGLSRIINGSLRSPHSGVDLKAPAGMEIIAANHGKVVLREEFFFAGKSIVLDHGGGLYTMYFHLSEFEVEKGSEVRQGDLIGRVGMTGRVTGPHLHWGARLNGARIDPFELVALH